LAKLSGGKHLSLAADTVDKKTVLKKIKEAAGIMDVDYNHPLSDTSIKTLIQKAKVTQVIVGEKESLFVYVPMEEHYTQSRRHTVHDRIKEEYSKVYPDTPILIGFVPLGFQGIDKKQEFKGKLDGTITE
jgi:hypothetical protein